MTSPKAIRDQIITILEAAKPENEKGRRVKKWLKGEPPARRYPGFPFGWVEWMGGPMQPSTMTAKSKIEDKFYVVVLDKHVDAEEAEDSIMDFAESVEAALDDDSTIGGLLAASYVINRDKEKRFRDNYSIVAVRVTLYTRRRE